MKIALATLALALMTTPVLAQTVVRGEDSTVFKKKTMLDFTDVSLEGQLTKPEGQYGLSRSKTKFNSLIKLRRHFQAEMQKSVEQL